MLRVTFHASSERNFQPVITGLAVLAERIHQGGGFTIYNVTRMKTGRDEAVGVEMVEIHNDEDSVFSSALDQVLSRNYLCQWRPHMNML
jgi:hypothetical protein